MTTSFAFIQSQSHWLLTVKSNSLIASVEHHHASFLKAQGLLLLKEVGSFKSNMEGRAVLLKTSTDKKGAVSVDRVIFRHIYSAPVWGIGHTSTVLCNKLQLPQRRTLPEHLPPSTQTLKPPSLIWHCRGGKVSKTNQTLATSFLRSPLHAKQPSRGYSDVGSQKVPIVC